ncbi:MAG: hypothetical protein KU37_06590 [Sulfuricurvum sp. PC08-66]|nr:MAG: hypothetical protein KU37_06590 [Sulfuricurvum sp. PC08-66]
MRALFWLVAVVALAWGELEFAQPKPTMDAPRKVVFVMTQGSDEEIQHVLSSANNVLKFYGPENVQMHIVGYYHGIRGLLAKEKAFVERVDTLMQYDVRFIACGNTMRTKKILESDLIEGVEVVTAGIAHVIERAQEGYVVVKP